MRHARSRVLLALAALLFWALWEPASVLAQDVLADEEAQLLRTLRLPRDPRRGPHEQYYERFVIRTSQGETFVGAYWRSQGSYVKEALDIFAIRPTAGRPVARRVYSGVLGGRILALEVADFDGDGRDDLLLVHLTGGMIATTGATALTQTLTGFAEVGVGDIGSDVWVYRDGGQLRVMVTGSVSEKVWEWGWSSAKGAFVRLREVDLLATSPVSWDPSAPGGEDTDDRFVVQKDQGRTFVVAYRRTRDRHELGVDIFEVEEITKEPTWRRVYRGSLGEEVVGFAVADFDGDGLEDLIFIVEPGGTDAARGVVALRETPTGFSKAFQAVGSDIMSYREKTQVRIMVKDRISKRAREFEWSASKQAFEVTRTLDLVY